MSSQWNVYHFPLCNYSDQSKPAISDETIFIGVEQWKVPNERGQNWLLRESVNRKQHCFVYKMADMKDVWAWEELCHILVYKIAHSWIIEVIQAGICWKGLWHNEDWHDLLLNKQEAVWQAVNYVTTMGRPILDHSWGNLIDQAHPTLKLWHVPLIWAM